MTALNKKRLLGWASYDFANTIFSAVVLTSYFPLYLTKISEKNIYLGLATTGSMILAGLVVPVLGALSDQTGKTKKYLIRATLLAVFFLCLFSLTVNPVWLVFLFFIACFFYHASLVFYNSLLPVAVPAEKEGFASGLGVGLGYLAVVLVLPLTSYVESLWGTRFIFAFSGVLFLIASVPLFLFVPERAVDQPVPFKWGLWKTEWQKVIEELRGVSKNLPVLLFLGGNFFVVDAINSMIFWFLVYVREIFHPPREELIGLLMAVNAAAFVYGLLSGFLTDKFGALKMMIVSAVILAASLLILSLSPDFTTLVVTALTGGALSIAAVWTSGRKALLDFAPPDKVGAYFGLYGLTTKISVVGSLLFSIVADVAGFRMALRVLLFPAVAGVIFLFLSQVFKKHER